MKIETNPTPKEKAEEIIDLFNTDEFLFYTISIHDAQRCALIHVNQILSFLEDDREGFNWKKYYEEVREKIINYKINQTK